MTEHAWQAGPVPLEFAIRGFRSATLSEADQHATSALLTDTLGFKLLAQEGNRFRYSLDSGDPAGTVDVLHLPHERHGRVLAGSVHHIAWRTPDDAQQLRWLDELSKLHYGVSPVIDRKYFHSIYFREPGDVLFEIATDPPGFSVDEAADQLGTHLVLPPWLEPQRSYLESVLPPVALPAAGVEATL